MWAVLAVAGAVVVATGWLPADDAWNVAVVRGGPVLGFLVAITVLAELADRSGVFDAAAAACARLGRGSTATLYLLIAALTSVTTVVLSIDTTAVLLTPVVLALSSRIGLRPLPFAVAVVWLANTASLLLPVSNLTNLLAQQREKLSGVEFATRMGLPELIAVVLTVGYLWLLFRRDLRGNYEMPAPQPRGDDWTFRVCAVACAALVPAVLLGVIPAIAAAGAAVAALVVFGVRDRSAVRVSLIPWRLVLFTEGLFLVVAAIARHGLIDFLAHLTGHSVVVTALVAGGAGNLVNNLPAYLAMEPAVPAGSTTALLAVLVGTNVGPLITVWGSLATLLWRERCKARGIEVSALRFAAIGLAGAPVIAAAAAAGLLLTG
ncbi:arsenic transporter [Skermania sp. ID1734]|uniref:SLC13 family permease n=1 Tax=Skermania sp. ID1734 TaxID=2597516 RepID=UPI00117BF8B5|nr:SLC13 family permease [Skermania sp. ID1734]TSD94673.1 arsenic transporter [Skermania sp. ID1734]